MMLFRWPRLACLGCALLLSGLLTAHAAAETLISREALIQDTRQLVRILETAHPDPYLHGGGKIAFHRRFQEILRSLPEEGLTVEEFYRRLLPFVAAVGDGHTTLFPPSRPGKVRPGIPLELDVVEDMLYVRNIHDRKDDLLLGACLVSVEGVPFAELIQRQAGLRGWDNPYQLLTLLARSLASGDGLEILLPEWKTPDRIRAVFRLLSGEDKERIFTLSEGPPTVPSPRPSRIALPLLEKIDFGYGFLDSDRKTAVLRIDGMSGYRENFEFFTAMGLVGWVQHLAGRVYSRYYGRPAPESLDETIAGIPSATETFKALVEEMAEAGTQVLIIDLRENPGGNSLMTHILAYFLCGEQAMKRLGESIYTVKKYSDVYFAQYREDDLEKINLRQPVPLTRDDYDFQDAFLFLDPDLFRKHMDEERNRYFAMIPTFRKEFESGRYAAGRRPEKVIIVTSARTYSSGFDMAASFFKLGAVLVGTPSGQAGNCFGDNLSANLTNSKIGLAVSYKRFVAFPGDDELGRILRPHHEITYADKASFGFDPNAEILLALRIAGAQDDRETTADIR